MIKHYIGIDLGTTHLKIALFNEEGVMLNLQILTTPIKNKEYQPQEILNLVINSIYPFLVKFNVYGLSITGMSESGLLVDKKTGKELTSIIPWHDRRTTSIAEKFKSLEAEYYKNTGLFNLYKNGIYKCIWGLTQTKASPKSVVWLSACDYLAFRLTGEIVTDPTFAARTYVYDMVMGTWDNQHLENLGLSELNLPEIKPSGSFIGLLKKQYSPYGNKIPVTISGHDHLCATYLFQNNKTKTICNSMGTAETMTIVEKLKKPNIKDFRNGITCGPFVQSKFCYKMVNIPSAGQSIEWVKNLNHKKLSFKEFDLVLEKQFKSSSVYFFPWLSGTGSPFYCDRIKGIYWGLTEDTSSEDLILAVFNGISFQERIILSLLDPDETLPLITTGRATNSKQWMQLKADITGRNIICSEMTEGTLVGAVKLMCKYNNLDFKTDLGKTRMYAPNKLNHQRYEESYKTYKKLSHSLVKIVEK